MYYQNHVRNFVGFIVEKIWHVPPEQDTEQDLELKENVAYGPVAIIND